jgi:ABC-2 type transport system permease protein
VVVAEGFAGRRDRAFTGGEPVRFEVGADPARMAEAAMLEGVLMKTLYEPLKKAMGGAEPVLVERTSLEPRRFGPNNAFAVTFPQAILWGVMGCAAGFGISLVVERTAGTLQRLAMAPLGRARILAGKALACFLTIVAVTAVLLLLAVVAFGVRPGSYPLLGLGILCNALGFTGLMMVLSVVGRTERAAGGIGWAVLVLLAMIGGGMIPLFVMPPWLQGLASVSPVKWGILALEGAVWRDFSFQEMLVPCGILVALGLACFAAGARLFRW